MSTDNNSTGNTSSEISNGGPVNSHGLYWFSDPVPECFVGHDGNHELNALEPRIEFVPENQPVQIVIQQVAFESWMNEFIQKYFGNSTLR